MRAALIRNANDHLLYIVREDKSYFVANIVQGDILKIPGEERITDLTNDTDLDARYVETMDGTLTFRLLPFTEKKIPVNPNNPFAGTGGGGSRGIYVQEEGTQVNGLFKTLNFIGGTVTVTDAGAGVANITITAGIGGSGTLNYVAKWTPNGSSLGNSQIFALRKLNQ